MPRKTFVNGQILTDTDLNDFLMNQSVMVFDNAAARSSSIGTPTEGMTTYLKDTNSYEVFDAVSWKDVKALAAGTAGSLLYSLGTATSWLAPGPQGNVLTSLGTGIEWAEAEGAAAFWLQAGTALRTTANFLTGNSFYAIEVYESSGTATLSFVGFNSSNVEVLNVSLTSEETRFFQAPASINSFYFSATSDCYFSVVPIEAATSTTVASTAITTSGTYVVSTQSLAVVFGAGGAGGGAGVNNTAGGGGGSGRFTSAIVQAGTYVATIGAGGVGSTAADGTSGGSTTFGTISAAGGNGGNFSSNSRGGNGGSGGGGGAISSQSTSGGTAGIRGSNGGNASAGGASSTGGTGSGTAIPGLLNLIVPSGTNSGGLYAGGGGGSIFGFNFSTDGSNAGTASGGGEGGSTRDGNSPVATARKGGNGANGIIYLIEVA